ncbi:MAG: hypothetical protein PHR28_05315 [candidate division Zixibacteria bacterium]|nr:hypothetical protein [candidate division Zixibacteria bacterium]
MTRILVLAMILTVLAGASGAQTTDLLKQALDSAGLTRADLGFQPKGYWNRYPVDIPYKVKSFDDLFAEPLRLYDYAVSFGEAVRRYCALARLDSLDDNLYNLVYSLGVERKVSGLRSFGANLSGAPSGEKPLLAAVENLYTAAGERTQYVTFNKKADWPDLKKELDQKIGAIPPEAAVALAALIENIREACWWRETAFRNVPDKIKNDVFYIRDLAETQGDGMVYYPQIDDAAKTMDFESLCYAGLKAAAASERAAKALTPHIKNIPAGLTLDIPTPYGRIIINGTEPDTTDGDDCLLIVDFGGNDVYGGPAGATSRPDRGVSVLIDLGGNDTYTCHDRQAPSFGTGILGVGVLYDAAGDDIYEGKIFSQGAGFLGIGVLFDKAGNDRYKAETSSQGAAYFGIGMAIDGDGDDSYYLYGDGQGMGGIGGGIGVLADYAGSDRYTAEPSAEIVNRGDYHSEFKVNANNAQGVGFGRRGDGSDGHSWAGGVGAIVDVSGDDIYTSGNWSLGCGYWFGTGICYDGAGNDEYQSVYFTQASGAHFCNGILLDEAGDDKHILTETAGAALGFGWDYTNALFIDRGGNDIYEAKIISYGLAQIRSMAFFFEMGGDDSYIYTKGQQGFGAATFREDYAVPNPVAPYNYYSKSAGVFIDAAGNDSYKIKDGDSVIVSDKFRNDAIWFTPEKADLAYGHNNFGVGLDASDGTIPELNIFDTGKK